MNNLLFFNKDGYPHNFQYNQDTNSWNGKILFDENSDQTFRTQSLHIFENVYPIDFNIQSDLLSMNYNNNSGITFKGETNFKNESITNIVKVNESSDFYSKWIYGKDFHKKFPTGTIVEFSNVTGNTSTGYLDFTEEQYFTVLSTKKNAILIITNTKNDIYQFIFESGYISSINMISINDYNRDLINETLFQNFYENKKISIINSELNDSIISVKKSGTTYTYLNELKLDGNIEQIFKLKINFLTERPKILQSNISISDNKYLNVGKYAQLLSPETTFTSLGETLIKKEVVFEDSIGNKLFDGIIFTIDSLVTNIHIGDITLNFKKYYNETKQYKYNSTLNNINQWNTISFHGVCDLKKGDIISLSGITGNTLLMHNREFGISNVVYNNTTNETILFVSGYIINESGSTYRITQILQHNQINSVEFTPSGDISSYNNTSITDAYCYSTNTSLNLTQTYISGTTENVHKNTILSFINKYKSFLQQNGIDCYYTYKNNDDYLSIESLFGTKYNYFTVSGFTNNIKIDDDFSLTNNGITKKYDIITNEKLSDEFTNRTSLNLYKNNIDSEILLNLNNDSNRFGFKLTLNGNEYSINFKNNTQDTIDEFIFLYNEIMYKNGFILNSGYNYNYSGYTLTISTDIDIWNLEVMVNILSTYKIINSERNKYIKISANEIKSNYTDLYDLNLSTGMILKISGSSYNTNNKEYNIISLNNNTIGLSYEGVFITENDINIKGDTREFLRKPRGEYNNDTYLRVYWETPYDNIIDNSIFLYDISGEQLKPYNNIESLKYIGQKPLINTNDNNVVILNYESNKDVTKINNPKFQQTVFDELLFKLEQLDSSTEFDWIPEPLEIFIGYNSTEEGVNNKILKIEKINKIENTDTNISFSGYTNSGSSITLNNFILNNDTIEYKSHIDFNFNNYGFKKNQLIKLYFKDQSDNDEFESDNINVYKISEINRNKIKIDTNYIHYANDTYSVDTYYNQNLSYFNTSGRTYYFNIEVQPENILSCIFYGQTEIEDIRYKINLNNLGIKSEDDIYEIFYQSDIQDNAIDYTILNKKRKELLSINREIYDYIGSYKSLINSINFFGYNDLFVYEYYKNIDHSSPLFGKLHKVLIPDIFDNTIKGWNEQDFINSKYQNQITWKKTNLFNLAYKITDDDGNNILIYSLDEIQYKLTKLKKWLRRNIIPISANLLDITGVSDTTHTLYQDYDESNQIKKSIVERSSTVVNFNYTSTLNFDSNYLVTINFYIMSGNTSSQIDNNNIPNSFSLKVKTYYLSGTTIENPTENLIPVQYFKVLKNDLTSFSFTLNKDIDPYIYIETTTYDNSGNGIGYVNNKMFYFDEPRNYWLVNNNFDLSKMIYYQTNDYIK